jgi:hypothetical protein
MRTLRSAIHRYCLVAVLLALGTLLMPAASPVEAQSGPGGKGFSVGPRADGNLLSWQGGTGQTGYMIFRTIDGAFSSSPIFLGPTATSYTDPVERGLVCYLLIALGTTPLAQSDLVCVLLGLRTEVGSPRSFTVRLNQGYTATLTWGAPAEGGQDGYTLLTLGGGQQPLPGTATTVSVPVSGFTCWVIVARQGTRNLGNSHGVCAVPGWSSLLPS